MIQVIRAVMLLTPELSPLKFQVYFNTDVLLLV